MNLDWGTVPDWVASVGTVGTLFIAVSGWRIQQRERHEEAQAAREQDLRDRLAQVRELTVWAERPGGGSTDGGATFRWDVKVQILNRSRSAFTDFRGVVNCSTEDGEIHVGLFTAPTLPPTAEGHIDEVRVPIVIPAKDPMNPRAPDVRIEWWATDANKVRWHHNIDGRLVEDTN